MEEMVREIHLILSWELWVSDFYAWFLLFWCVVERTKRLVFYMIWARFRKLKDGCFVGLNVIIDYEWCYWCLKMCSRPINLHRD